MHDFSRFSCVWSGTKTLLFTEAGVKVTFTFTRANVIHREQKFTHKLALRNDGVVVFMGGMGVYECRGVYGFLWVPMGFWVFLGVYGWVSMGVYSFLGIYGYLWVS